MEMFPYQMFFFQKLVQFLNGSKVDFFFFKLEYSQEMHNQPLINKIFQFKSGTSQTILPPKRTTQ